MHGLMVYSLVFTSKLDVYLV